MKTTVLVFFGGMSREHDISMMTGAAVIHNLPAAGYEPLPCVINTDGTMGFPPAGDLAAAVPFHPFHRAVGIIHDMAPDCVFIGLHGTFGEDGRIQSLCDLMGLPYVGADSIGSAVGIDKWASKAIYMASGVPTPEGVMLQGSDLDDPAMIESVRDRIGFPMVIKATREGSSFGVAIAWSADEMGLRLEEVRSTSAMIVFEKYKKGREFSVPVIEDPVSGELSSLPAIEIIHGGKFFDYQGKYFAPATKEVCPADVDSESATRMAAAAMKAHRALMLAGYSRTDFILDGQGSIWALETNTLPGMTDKSLFPKAAAAVGMTYPQLLDTLIRRAMNRISMKS